MALKRRFVLMLAISFVSASLALAAPTAGPARAQAAPATLTGEQLFACTATTFISGVPDCGLGTPIGSTVTERACAYPESGSFTFTASGNATGPYPGTFSEVGTVELGPGDLGSQPVLTFEASFTIDSPAGQVEGTKTLQMSRNGLCADGSPFFTASANVEVTYEAVITTADGQFEDHGTGTAIVFHAAAGSAGSPQTIFSFHETFASDLDEENPVPPADKKDCKDRYADFGFATRKECKDAVKEQKRAQR